MREDAAEKLLRDAAVAPPSPPPPVGVAPIVTTAKSLIAQGNLIGAARTIVGGLKDNPKNSDLTGRFSRSIAPPKPRRLTRESRRMLRGAKAGPTSRWHRAPSDSTQLDSYHWTGDRSIVREFDAAADLYRAAAARVKTDPRSLDEFAISKLLADYVEAYNTMDVIRVRRFKPSFTDFSRDLSSTQLTISDIRIVLSPDRQTAGVTLTAQYRNTFKKGVGASSTPASKLTWRAQRKGDAWILLE